MTRDDLKRFRSLDIDFESIGLLQSGADGFAYFCTPTDAEFVGRIGCDGVQDRKSTRLNSSHWS